jgi:hypothetical protein
VLFSPSSKLSGFAFSDVETVQRAASTSGESDEVDVPTEEDEQE